MGLTAMAIHHPMTSWIFCCRSRRTLTPAQDPLPLAPWARDRALDQVQDRVQAAMAVVPQRVELLAAEQVSEST